MYDICVLVPCYNAQDYLNRLLDSLFDLEHEAKRVQIIIVDDGSQDESRAIVESRMNDIPAEWQLKSLAIDHAGQAAAISAGLKYVNARYLTWADADDVALPGYFSERLNYFREHPQRKMVRNNIILDKSDLNQPDTLLFEGPLRNEVDDLFAGMFKGDYPTAGAGVYAISSESFFEIYPDKTIPVSEGGQNFQLVLPALSKFACGYIDQPLYRYIHRAESHSNQPRSIVEVLKRIDTFHDLLIELIPFCDFDPAVLKDYADAYQSTERLRYLKSAAQLSGATARRRSPAPRSF